MGPAVSHRETVGLLGRAVGSLDNGPTAPAFFEEETI